MTTKHTKIINTRLSWNRINWRSLFTHFLIKKLEQDSQTVIIILYKWLPLTLSVWQASIAYIFWNPVKKMSAGLRFCICLSLILLSFPLSETRPLSNQHIHIQIRRRNLSSLIRILGEDANEVLNIGLENEKKNKDLYGSKRSSPGGPDAHHHSTNN